MSRLQFNMAAVDIWRTCLNEHPFCKHLRENNAKDSNAKLQHDSKGLVAIQDGNLYVWDSYSAHLVHFNLKNLLPEAQERYRRFQILQCTDAPKFDVEWLTFNQAGSHLAIWGQLGITVVELPRRWGKFAEFEGGKDNVLCKSLSIAEHYFASHHGVKLQKVAWHPGSPTDTHIVFLTSDNVLSIYNILEPDRPTQVIHLGDRELSQNLSITNTSFGVLLGDHAVSFDFGKSEEIRPRHRPYTEQTLVKHSVYPVYVVRGNGDVVLAYTDVNSERPIKLPVQGPLVMHPPAEDNYGTDACSILCLETVPPVVVVATCEGRLHHCVLFNGGPEDSAVQSEASWKEFSADSPSLFENPDEPSLYVYESIELELSLTTTNVNTDEPIEDDFTCPIRLLCDPASPDRYHCIHSAGVHSVAIPWISQYQQFCVEERIDSELPDHQDCVVEHLICTKPLPSSPPAPVLGLGVVRDPVLGPRLLALTSDIDFVSLPLSTRYHCPAPSLVSSSPGQQLPSPLRRLNKEPFHQHITRILHKASSNPLLRSSQKTTLTQQECFQLLTRTTQVFREEYIQKQNHAKQETDKRVRILKKQKEQQLQDIQLLKEQKTVLCEKAQDLAIRYEDCQEIQEDLLQRLENVTRKLQSRVPVLSEAERSMKRELELMEAKLEGHSKHLDQLKVKQSYQHRQISQAQSSSLPSPVLKKNQLHHLKAILKQEDKDLTELVGKLKTMQVDAGV